MKKQTVILLTVVMFCFVVWVAQVVHANSEPGPYACSTDALGGDPGVYCAGYMAPDYLTTTPNPENPNVTLLVTEGNGTPENTSDVIRFAKPNGATAIFFGRTLGWGCNYTVKGVYAGTGSGGSEKWENHFHHLGIKVIKVPDYLYADATGYVPVKFQFYNAGGQVEICGDTVFVSFHIGGNVKFSCVAKYAAGDGFGQTNGNGTTNIYTAWVPINGDTFRSSACDLNANLTNDATFKVSATIKYTKDGVKGDYHVESPTIASVDSAKPKVFGDKDIQVVELGEQPTAGVGETFSATDGTQPYVHRTAEYMADHLASMDFSAWGGHTFPYHLGNLSAVFDLDFDSAYMETQSGDDFRKVYTYLKDDTWETPDVGHTVSLKATGETIGIYFGVSYPLKQIPVVNAKGMDLTKTFGTLDITLFENGRASFEAISVGQEENLGMVVIAESIGVGACLVTGAWIPASIAAAAGAVALANDIATTDANDMDSAHAVVQLISSHKVYNASSPTITNLNGPYSTTSDAASDDVAISLTSEGLSTHVGDTWCRYVVLSCAVSAKSVFGGVFGAEVGSGAMYYLNNNDKFSDTDIAKILTNVID